MSYGTTIVAVARILSWFIAIDAYVHVVMILENSRPNALLRSYLLFVSVAGIFRVESQ